MTVEAPGGDAQASHNGSVTPLLRRAKNPADRTVTLIGKPDCHLCEQAREVIARVTAELGAGFEERDITQDQELYRKYWEQIPVTLVDGRQHDFWRVDETRLRAALTR
ncbi:glutaredoxin [Kitasatospora sp. GAS204A]|nr:glutaredoxin [Kitasatospora sp. GAS204B]